MQLEFIAHAPISLALNTALSWAQAMCSFHCAHTPGAAGLFRLRSIRPATRLFRLRSIRRFRGHRLCARFTARIRLVPLGYFACAQYAQFLQCDPIMPFSILHNLLIVPSDYSASMKSECKIYYVKPELFDVVTMARGRG